MPTGRDESAPQPRGGKHNFYALAGLALLVLVAHGGALWDGVFYDDHWHRETARDFGWGWNDLIESTTFDFPGLIHLWWQEQPVHIRYPRPVALLIMKLEYHLAGGSPVGIHAAGLIWHWLTAFLVYRLAYWAIGVPGWALLAAGLFVLNPNAVFSVSWSAARNAVVGAFFLVAAVVAYASVSFNRQRQPAPLRAGPIALCIALWGASLLCRETGIMFPLLAVALDACFGGGRHLLRRLPLHGLFALLALAYLYWRLFVFPDGDLPQVYYSRPEGLGYLLWAASKMLQMVFMLLLYVPLFGVIDTAESGWTARVLLIHAIMLALMVPALIHNIIFSRGLRGRWFWPLWVIACFLPVVPVAPMPHFGYLPFIGYVVGICVLISRPSGRRRIPVAVLFVVAITAALVVHRVVWRGAFRAEQLVYADIVANTPPPKPGSTFFIINAPTWTTFATAALREAWDVRDLDGQILTFSPEPYRMRRPSTVQPLNDHELLISTPPPGYFAGSLERALLKMTRPDSPLTPGTTVRGELLDATVLETVDGGVTKLKFTFHKPLDSDDYYFFVSTPERPARRLRFGSEFGPEALAQETARWRAEHAAMIADRDRFLWLVDLVSRE